MLGNTVLDGIFWLKFLLETRLQSEIFEPLIGFLAFQVQKLWHKNNKLGAQGQVTEPKTHPTHDSQSVNCIFHDCMVQQKDYECWWNDNKVNMLAKPRKNKDKGDQRILFITKKWKRKHTHAKEKTLDV